MLPDPRAPLLNVDVLVFNDSRSEGPSIIDASASVVVRADCVDSNLRSGTRTGAPYVLFDPGATWFEPKGCMLLEPGTDGLVDGLRGGAVTGVGLSRLSIEGRVRSLACMAEGWPEDFVREYDVWYGGCGCNEV